MIIATALRDRVIAINTRPAPAALTTKSWSGRDTQLNICIGSTENGDQSHSPLTNGGYDWIGDGGRNAMNVSAPIVISGAVSPMALERAMIIPVRIPPVE